MKICFDCDEVAFAIICSRQADDKMEKFQIKTLDCQKNLIKDYKKDLSNDRIFNCTLIIRIGDRGAKLEKEFEWKS
jgi:hypothetical protein